MRITASLRVLQGRLMNQSALFSLYWPSLLRPVKRENKEAQRTRASERGRGEERRVKGLSLV